MPSLPCKDTSVCSATPCKRVSCRNKKQRPGQVQLRLTGWQALRDAYVY
jgi:hypothetical protein